MRCVLKDRAPIGSISKVVIMVISPSSGGDTKSTAPRDPDLGAQGRRSTLIEASTREHCRSWSLLA